MLAWFGLDETAAPGAADRLIADLARDLQARGLRVAGAVQTNHDLGPDCACDMDMQVIGDGAAPVRISQSLGAGASGCRWIPARSRRSWPAPPRPCPAPIWSSSRNSAGRRRWVAAFTA